MVVLIQKVIVTLLACMIFCKAGNIPSKEVNNHVINAPSSPTISSTATPTETPQAVAHDNNMLKVKKKVLILDVDNTLYKEDELKLLHGLGMEQQIIENTYAFGTKYFNLSKDECDALYHEYGSTCEGLRHIMAREGKTELEINQLMSQFYQEVWDGIDVSPLLSLSSPLSNNHNTGYSHEKTAKERQVLIDILQSLQLEVPIYIASNSPKRYVLKVLKALGLGQIKIKDILTPDSRRGRGVTQRYPTKTNAPSFYYPLLQKFDSGTHDIMLLDDSFTNIKKGGEIGFKGIRVNGEGGKTLKEALSIFLGHIDALSYDFSDVSYLQSKNKVDLVSINEEVWVNVAKELIRVMNKSSTNVARIVDLGAGLLSILEMILIGGGGKEALVDLVRKSKPIEEIEYIAYESNKNLLDACWDRLYKMGFVGLVDDGGKQEKDEYLFEQVIDDIKVTVKLRVKSFIDDTVGDDESNPHLIVGCCFADLFDPQDLTTAIMRFLKHSTVEGGMDGSTKSSHETLLYFPITFAGTTQFLPPKPFGTAGESPKVIPSDAFAFQVYAQSLIGQHGHNLDPRKIIDAMSNSQAKLLFNGSSVWNIDPDSDKYLWETMMYFFASSTGPMMLKWDFKGWVSRAKTERPKIRVVNQDLLFSLSSDMEIISREENNSSINTSQECHDSFAGEVVDEIIFTSPYNVGKITEEWDTRNNRHLKPGQVEVKAICSLISSGTELKIFKGMFDDAALDVNIKGMEDEVMRYPLSYGYSLVGVVTRCAPDVDEDIIGRNVFTFSPHSSRVIVDRDAVQIIPDGISPEDAIFMPSVETALSIVHDAHHRAGENVVVYGQGLIGLLVNAILSQSTQQLHSNGRFNIVTAVDTLSDRLAMASVMGASEVLLPSDVTAAGPFDVSIEVSGNSKALQSAIDNTRDGGRVIVGSWYGNSDIKLKLGIDFHRSHKTIKTSQVSAIPGELSSLWSKERRFALTWDLVRLIQPSRLITKRLSLDKAQLAYELLDKGKEIAISFVYN